MHIAASSGLLATLLLPLVHGTPVVRDPPTKVNARDVPSTATATVLPTEPADPFPPNSCRASFTAYRTSDNTKYWAGELKAKDANGGDIAVESMLPSDGAIGLDHDSAAKFKISTLPNELWIWQYKNVDGNYGDGQLVFGYDTTWWDTRNMMTEEEAQNGGSDVNRPYAQPSQWWALEDAPHPEGANQRREITVGWKC